MFKVFVSFMILAGVLLQALPSVAAIKQQDLILEHEAEPKDRSIRTSDGKRRTLRRKKAAQEFSKAVLMPNETLASGQFVYSLRGLYEFGIYPNGDLMLKKSSDKRVLWRAGVSDAALCLVQRDGNLVALNKKRKVIWKSDTRAPGAFLVLDIVGQLSLIKGKTLVWLAGKPFSTYSKPSSTDLTFPVRGIFYYPWFPETWSVEGKQVFYGPTLSKYSSDDPLVQASHIKSLQYGNIDLGIASWWGPNTNSDRARITSLLLASRNTNVKWAIYHEKEFTTDPTVQKIRNDLNYLKKWFAWHDEYAHVDRRPVIFIYNDGGCDVVNRWVTANKGEWYIVLKVFQNYLDCPNQPDHWHQYAPAKALASQPGFSTTISPGFWRADMAAPMLPRVGKQVWRQNVAKMVNSKDDWQLITSFNEWGEGTSVESAREWDSSSGYGFYLDALHDIKS